MAKNVSYRGKKEVAPAEGRIPYDTSVWQARDSGDYIHMLTGEVRDEAQFDFNAPAPAATASKSSGEDDDSGDGERDASSSGSSDASSDWDEDSQDTGADFGGAQMKIATKSVEGGAGDDAGKGKSTSKAKSKKR